MKKVLKHVIKKTPFYSPLRNWMLKNRLEKGFRKWENNGRPVPPPHIVKQCVLKNYAKKYNLKILVETGTYYGDMIEVMKNFFEKIYSIELDQNLYEKAKERFRFEKHIELLQGDSGKELEKVMKKINQPALFWLDGHYSGGVTAKGDKYTPVYDELKTILNMKDLGHVIIIDDARCFGTVRDYLPIEETKKFIHTEKENIQVTVEGDSIRIVPNLYLSKKVLHS